MKVTLSIQLAAAPTVFPHVEHALGALAQHAHSRWLAYAAGETLPSGDRIKARSGAYLKSIQLEQRGPLTWEVFSDAPYAAEIERGSPPRDMKAVLGTSKRARQAKDGSRYLIIPFRWGTAGTVTFGANTMTADEHELARHLAPSRITGTGTRESANYPGVHVPQHSYHWGGRLTHQALKQAGLRGLTFAQARRARRLTGMVKFQQSGSSKHSQYLTFRVMSEKSTGWIRPAVPGKWPAKTVNDAVRDKARAVLKEALQRDVQLVLGGAYRAS